MENRQRNIIMNKINIKFKLKDLGLTLAECADKLMISRPTLDSYIELYENNKPIPREKYQIVFDRLFLGEVSNREEFISEVNNLHFLIERDKMLGTLELDTKKTDIITAVISEMKNDMYESDCNMDMYIFINMFIRSYRKNLIFQKLANYFLVLNGQINVDSINEDEQRFFSNCYKLFYEELHNMSKLNGDYLKMFYKRVKCLNNEKLKQVDEIKSELSNKLTNRISELVELGIDVKDININELLKDIKSNK